MTLLAQHGYGKSDKIEGALDAGYVGGVILAAKSETPEKIKEYVEALTASHAPDVLLFDPQFHISMVSPANYGKLLKYPYFSPGLSRRDFIKSSQIDSFVEGTLQFQMPLATTGVIAPSVRVTSFSDSSSQIALQLADASATYWAKDGDDRPLYISIVVDEGALDHRGDLDAYLDALTLTECQGFYVIVARANQVYSPRFPAERLAALMYMSFVLQEVNGFSVVGGYSDFPGLLQVAAGAEAIASGWYHSLRYFCVSHLRPRSFGRQPRPRYSSIPALESILISDLGKAFEAGVVDSLLTGTDEDAPFRAAHPDGVPWTKPTETLHHWAALSSALAEIEGLGVPDALEQARDWISHAETVLEDARLIGVEFDPSVGAHLPDWRDAIDLFADAVDLTGGV